MTAKSGRDSNPPPGDGKTGSMRQRFRVRIGPAENFGGHPPAYPAPKQRRWRQSVRVREANHAGVGGMPCWIRCRADQGFAFRNSINAIAFGVRGFFEGISALASRKYPAFCVTIQREKIVAARMVFESALEMVKVGVPHPRRDLSHHAGEGECFRAVENARRYDLDRKISGSQLRAGKRRATSESELTAEF